MIRIPSARISRMKTGSMGFDLPRGGGAILVDKTGGPTSHDAVLILRRLLRTSKVGHTGTLDPMATGLLVLCVGAATKLTAYLSGRDKEYTGTITFGTVTDSLDAMGNVVESRDVPLPLDERALSRAMESMVGEISQLPPMTSAVKVSGQRLHKLARRGVHVERRPRIVSVKEFELLGCEEGRVHFRVVCSSGTYVRCLAYDLGVSLGWGAHLSALRRTKVGRFAVGEAVTLDELAEMSSAEAMRRLIPAAQLVDFLPFVVLGAEGIRILRSGGIAPGETVLKWDACTGGDLLRVLDESGVLRAIGTATGREGDGQPTAIRPVRVLVD
jgi:tRNA pseudouridine55 synthase